jgi:hypothetical protein
LDRSFPVLDWQHRRVPGCARDNTPLPGRTGLLCPQWRLHRDGK